MRGKEHPVAREESGLVVRHKRAYAERRRKQSLSTLPVAALALALGVGGGAVPGVTAGASAAVVGAVVLGFFGFSLVNWRCPACDAYLGQRLNPKRCPSCGQELRD